MLINKPNRKERALRRWYIAMRIARPAVLLLMLLAWVAASPSGVPLLLAMAAGDVLLDGSGNVKLDASGNVVLDDGAGSTCCCNHCDHCSDDVPSNYILTISGVTACGAGCLNNCQFLGQSAQLTATNVNGTFTLPYTRQLPFSGTPCRWLYDPGTPTETVYNSTGCTGTVFNTPSLQYVIDKYVAASGFTVTVGITPQCGTYFSGGFLSTATCGDVGGYSVSNNATICGTFGGGINGTASWTPA